jgi:hypothetical protein
MKKTILTPQFLAVFCFLIIAALTRLLPHPPNFTAVGALALFGGANLKDRRMAILLPLLCMAFTDLFIPYGFDTGVYLSFIITGFIGIAIRNNQSVLRIFGASVASSVVFFLITNLVLWHTIAPLYPSTFQGQMQSYMMALPFFKTTLVSELFCNAVFFGSFALLKRTYPALARS